MEVMTNHRANRIRETYRGYHQEMAEIAGEGAELSVLKEHFDRVVQDLLAFEDRDWMVLSGFTDQKDKGLTLKNVKEVTPFLEKNTKIYGDLLGKGLRLKNNHVFGRGFTYEGKNGKIQPRFQAIIDDPHNQSEVFSPTALKAINRIFFTSGNLVLMYDRNERLFHKLAIDVDIENVVKDVSHPSRIKYYLRVWTVQDDINGGEPDEKRELVPTASYDATRPDYPAFIRVGENNIPVNRNAVIIDARLNRDNGETWGVPDAFAAAAPAVIYANYIKDAAMVQHALAAISHVVKAKTQAAAKTAGAKLQTGRIAQAAITGPETEIQAMPRAGTVNMYEGRPLAARVASALDVSVTGLTADTGTGGSYASENALSAPEQMSALSRQEDFANLFREIFRVIGAEGATINFKRLDVDPVHRQMQSLGLARTLGFIHQAEGRERTLELLDIEPTSEEMPEPDEFTGSKYSTLAEQIDAEITAQDKAAQAAANPIPSQGNSGAVGSLDQSGNDSKASDNAAGTA